MKEKVSIVVPIYNAQNTLERCIQSLVEQTYSEIEIILVDDGSKDNSLSICEKWQGKNEKIIVIHKENAGVSEARNTGIKTATRQVYMFCRFG